MSFASSFAAGLQMADFKKQRDADKAIEAAGKFATNAIEEEKKVRAFSSQPQDSQASNQIIRDPSIYQQGDSLGMQGYNVGNKPIQTTVPTAPMGYQSNADNRSENDLSPGGLEYPSANPSTEQTLLGNYGTTASFKGEKPTREDALAMQQDTQAPFRGPQDQSVIDLANVSPTAKETPPAEPKAFATFNEKISAADRAKESYDYNMRVIRRLQETGNAKAALDYQTKVYNSELTLSEANSKKFTTAASISKQVGNLAANTLEAMQEPGTDVNKLYFETMNKARDMYGYDGKIPFSLDPNQNIRTLQMLQKDALTVSEKADLGIKDEAARWKKTTDTIDIQIKEQKLGLDKLLAVNTLTKTQQEIATSQFNRLNETIKSQFQAINSINPTITDKDKEALKVSYDANLKDLQKYSKALNIPMPSVEAVGTPNISLGNKKAPQPSMVNTAGNPPAQPNVNTQQVNNAFPEDVLKEANIQETAGGFVPPTPKTPAQEKQAETTRMATKKNIQDQITALQESRKGAPQRGVEATGRGLKIAGEAISSTASSGYKSSKDWLIGKSDKEVNAKLAELQKQLDALK